MKKRRRNNAVRFVEIFHPLLLHENHQNEKNEIPRKMEFEWIYIV